MIMRIVVFVLLMLASIRLSAQKYFEGEIEYAAKVVFQDSVASPETLNHFNHTLYFKDNRYKKVYKDGRSEYYYPDKGVLYYYPSIPREYDTIKGITTRSGYDEYEVKRTNEKEYILSIPCQAINFQTKEETDPLLKVLNTSITYFFNKEYYRVNPDLFLDHKSDFLNKYFKEAGVLPLKVIIDTYMMKIEYLAVRVKKRKLKDKDFVLPAN